LETEKTLLGAETEVKELTESLNLLPGYATETELELVTPAARFEEISLTEASDKAMAANPDVVETEKRLLKYTRQRSSQSSTTSQTSHCSAATLTTLTRYHCFRETFRSSALWVRTTCLILANASTP